MHFFLACRDSEQQKCACKAGLLRAEFFAAALDRDGFGGGAACAQWFISTQQLCSTLVSQWRTDEAANLAQVRA